MFSCMIFPSRFNFTHTHVCARARAFSNDYIMLVLCIFLIWMQIHPSSPVFASAVASRLMEVVDEY